MGETDMIRKRDNEAGNLDSYRPESVQELIALLQSFPPTHRISFTPFNLHCVAIKEEEVHFEMQETEGEHYNMSENLDG